MHSDFARQGATVYQMRPTAEEVGGEPIPAMFAIAECFSTEDADLVLRALQFCEDAAVFAQQKVEDTEFSARVAVLPKDRYRVAETPTGFDVYSNVTDPSFT